MEMRNAGIVAESPDAQADDLFEIANLRQRQTGVSGTVTISTAQASHGPRVKHYAGRPGNGVPYFSVSIEQEPKIVEIKGVPEPELNAVSDAVLEWVRLNHEKLADFWFHGTSWFDEEVTAFKRSLTKISPKRQKRNAKGP